MDFEYDDEQTALREAVRGLLGKAYADFEQRRRTVAEEPGFDDGVWSQLAAMGVLGLPFAEEDGGMGAGPVEVGIVAAELGRVLAPEPFVASVVLAGGAVAAAGTAEQRAEVLGALVEGTTVLALAHDAPGTRWAATGEGVRATDDGGRWALTGTKEPVLHGARADRLVVSALLPGGGTGLFLVDGDAEGVTRVGYPTYDGGRAAKVTLDGAAATRLGDDSAEDQAPVLETVLDSARLATCHEALGGMQTALHATTDYLKSRKQFGVPLRTFQTLTFRAADMYVSLELTTSLVQWATMVAATGDRAATVEAVRRAALQVSRAGRHIGQEAIQLHGGIAMTAEYVVGNVTAHLTLLDHLLGDGDHHLAALMRDVADHAPLDPLDPLGSR